MDNDAFRSTYRAVNERFCPYEKSILTNSCGCALARKFCIAEREGVQCSDEAAQTTCLHLLDLLRQQARFALKSTDTQSALPHAKAMRVQVGGLRGIRAALAPEQPVPSHVDDIRATILAAIEAFGSLEQLPFQLVMQQIAAYQGRKRIRRGGK
ncbi:hypothetical protein G3480_09585 [Thiorhodococcus mannitoliphagus]|uniref:Uncharacterized protein n=1 Tax=Thiorhodococcus mannitoliphagus TaxID=329406 RepID=A0A6P1DRS2_9GAMM|nr:hypothetical protein [Thiorhodococcus mannitoliphagus]NEX20559.1 hypothetical protein [Thiorhodococcus mannitoliphagus]